MVFGSSVLRLSYAESESRTTTVWLWFSRIRLPGWTSLAIWSFLEWQPSSLCSFDLCPCYSCQPKWRQASILASLETSSCSPHSAAGYARATGWQSCSSSSSSCWQLVSNWSSSSSSSVNHYFFTSSICELQLSSMRLSRTRRFLF